MGEAAGRDGFDTCVFNILVQQECGFLICLAIVTGVIGQVVWPKTGCVRKAEMLPADCPAVKVKVSGK